MPTVRACAVGVGVLVAALLGTGPGLAQSPGSAIPDELAVIAAACRENSARIQSLQLSGTLVATGGHYEGQWDPITGQTYNSQTQEFSIWKDALNCRFDVTADREVSPENEVKYQIGYGEHIASYAKLEWEGGVDELKAKYGTPRSTTRTIATPDQGYEYRPESNQLTLNIEPPTVQALYEQQGGVQFALNKVLRGNTLAEFVDRWAELAKRGDRSIEVTPLGNGQYHIRATVTSQREGEPTRCDVRDIVADLDQGGNVLSYVVQTNGQIVEKAQFDYMNAGGAWVVAHAEIAARVAPDLPVVNGVYDVHPDSVRINEPIDPQVFSFEGLAVRRGALVFDVKTREEYLYDDVPLHVKAALAMAREREEELAAPAAQAPQSPPPAPGDAPAEDPQPGQTGALAGSAAVRTPRATSVPTSMVVVPPQTQAATVPDTMPAEEAPVATRPAATPGVPHSQEAQQDNPTSPPSAAGSMAPSTVVTVVVASAGCAAALGIVVWKLTRCGTTPRAG